jgi:hypothetical protein
MTVLGMGLAFALDLGCNNRQQDAALEAERRQLEVEKKQLQEERKAFEEERQQFQKARAEAAKRPLAERLLGSWTAEDSHSDLRDITFAKDGSATVSSMFATDTKPVLRRARYELAGKSLKVQILLEGSFQSGSSASVSLMIEVVSVSEQELVLRRDKRVKDGVFVANDKWERFVRP